MSKRLQIVMSDSKAASLRRAGLTPSEWARRALRAARDARAVPSPGSPLDALDRALACNHPTGDIDEMLAESPAERSPNHPLNVRRITR